MEHSLSPAMHNAAIAALGLHFVYIPLSVLPDDVGPAIQSLPTLGIVGANLTIPHKESVIPFLDEVTPDARAVGAVNTVHVVDRRLIGHNTDGDGFIVPLQKRDFQFAGAKAVVLGAGGAARSVVYRLADECADILIVNRDRIRAERLAEQVRIHVSAARIRVASFDDLLESEIESAGLIVNSTSVGMHPNNSEIPPIPLNALHVGQIVYDLVYRPVETRLLASARKVGVETIDGTAMLVHQGAAAFRIWTGIDPPIAVMESAVLEGLNIR